jgi:hypothetical protein
LRTQVMFVNQERREKAPELVLGFYGDGRGDLAVGVPRKRATRGHADAADLGDAAGKDVGTGSADVAAGTASTDSNSDSAMCQVRSSIALRWAKETGGGASGPTLKKGSWVRAEVES